MMARGIRENLLIVSEPGCEGVSTAPHLPEFPTNPSCGVRCRRGVAQAFEKVHDAKGHEAGKENACMERNVLWWEVSVCTIASAKNKCTDQAAG